LLELAPRGDLRAVLLGRALAPPRLLQARLHDAVDLERRRDGRDEALAVDHYRDRDRTDLGAAHPGLDRAPAEHALVAVLRVALGVERERVAERLALAREQRGDRRLVVAPLV